MECEGRSFSRSRRGPGFDSPGWSAGHRGPVLAAPDEMFGRSSVTHRMAGLAESASLPTTVCACNSGRPFFLASLHVFPAWKPEFGSQKLWFARVAGSFGVGTLGPDPVPHFPRVPTAGQLLMPSTGPSASGLLCAWLAAALGGCTPVPPAGPALTLPAASSSSSSAELCWVTTPAVLTSSGLRHMPLLGAPTSDRTAARPRGRTTGFGRCLPGLCH